MNDTVLKRTQTKRPTAFWNVEVLAEVNDLLLSNNMAWNT